MIISGIEKELGATYEARRIVDNELVYGIAIIKVNIPRTPNIIPFPFS